MTASAQSVRVDCDAFDRIMLEDLIAHQRTRRTWPAEVLELLLRAAHLIAESQPCPEDWLG